jgi:hypothetical protein
MMASIDLIKDNSKVMQIGIDNEEAPKAHGHMTGDGTAPRRPFLGVTKEDLKEIKEKYADEIGNAPEIKSKGVFTANDFFDAVTFANTFRELKKRGII